MHRDDSKICRPTADRHSTCSVLNKTAPPVHGADGTQSIRTRFLRLFPCPDFLIALLPGAHSNTANRRLCCSESRSELRSLLLSHDCENPAKHYQAAKNQTDSRYKTLVGRGIAISRTPPSPASGWGCRERRFLVQAQCCCARILFWHSFAVDSNSLNSVVSRSLTSNGSVLRAV